MSDAMSPARYWAGFVHRRRFAGASLACKEQGSSVVSFIMALPLILLFLFAVIDLGRMVFLHMALNDAAYAVCQEIREGSLSDPSPDRLRAVALGASPALAANDLHLAITTHRGDEVERPFTSKFYDESSKAFSERCVAARTRAITIEVMVEGSFLTPLGPGLASLGGGAGRSFCYRARTVSLKDTTLEGGR